MSVRPWSTARARGEGESTVDVQHGMKTHRTRVPPPNKDLVLHRHVADFVSQWSRAKPESQYRRLVQQADCAGSRVGASTQCLHHVIPRIVKYVADVVTPPPTS